jgi:pimeloyl-ACP methyl ester carboxylesterase
VPAPDLDPAASIAFVDVDGARLRTATWGDGAASIVLLHDGLGSIGQWRDVPFAVHRSTGATVMAYERAGHGASTPAPSGPWPADWLHQEAAVLDGLIGRVGIESPTLVGHSDGGSIALIQAATSGPCQSVVVLAAHTWVEDVCVESIRTMRAERAHFVTALSRHHDAPGAVFEAWSGGWVSDEFASWDIRPLIRDIECPVLVVQGTRDEYATDAQLTETVDAIGANAGLHRVERGGHVLHHDEPDQVVALIASFYDQHGSAVPAEQEE